MDKLNESQVQTIEEFIESLICPYCSEIEDKDCSSCIIHQQLKENILHNCKLN